VLHPGEGAFNAWVGGLPPAEIAIGNSAHFSSTRVAATVSEVLRREVQTNGDMGIAFALIERPGPAGSLVTFDLDTTCALSDGQGNIIDRDTCRSGNALRIRPDMACTSPRIRDCLDLGTGGFTPCNPGIDQNCVTGDSWWKYTLMHEFGHFVQGAAIGNLSPSYTFNGAPDLPGAPPLCGCGHVQGANALHCLQSIEQPNAAQIEGWAQFYTSKVWNDDRGTDCTFNYYKEFLFPGAAAAVLPPVPVSCKAPVRWRNTHCTGSPAFSGTALADMGTELDWMTFLWNVNTVPVNGSTMRNISDAYILACSSPSAPSLCDSGDIVTWEATPSSGSLSTGAQSLFTGDAPRAQLFQQMGDLYGVSRDTVPSP